MSSDDTPYDSALSATWKHPPQLRAASEEVTAAVELGWAAARTVFGKQAKPQHAIDLARMFIEEARQRRPAEAPFAEPTGLDAPRSTVSPSARARNDSRKKAKGGVSADGVKTAEVTPTTPVPPRTRKTAVSGEPPRAPSKIGRPARM